MKINTSQAWCADHAGQRKPQTAFSVVAQLAARPIIQNRSIWQTTLASVAQVAATKSF